MGRKWKPSKTAAREFAAEMREIELFCQENGIRQSHSGDSYYFRIGEVEYRVSNHSVEASNHAAYDGMTGGLKREFYHPEGRDGIVCIHAGKTRIKQIYSDLVAGYELDGHGNRKGGKKE